MTACSVTECDRPTKAYGMCNMHYLRWKKYGDPSVVRVERSRRQWTERDLFQLEDLLAQGLSDAVIAKRLGCTPEAVNLARKRHGLRSRSALLLSSREIARRLGIGCAKTVTRWIEAGWLVGKQGPRRGPYRQWQVTELNLWAFMESPDHWHRWDAERIPDPYLREWAIGVRGGVRFLTPGQVAWRLCVGVGAVNDWIRAGLLPAVRNGNWLVRESDLADFTPPGQQSKTGMTHQQWTPEEDARLLSLRATGLTFERVADELGRSLGSVTNRWYRLVAMQEDEAAA